MTKVVGPKKMAPLTNKQFDKLFPPKRKQKLKKDLKGIFNQRIKRLIKQKAPLRDFPIPIRIRGK